MEGIQNCIVNTYEPKSKKAQKGIGSGIVSFGVTALIPSLILYPLFIKGTKKISNKLNADELTIIETATDKVLETTGLKAKGTTIFKVSTQNQEELAKMVMADLNDGIKKFLPQKLKNIRCKHICESFIVGENAAYHPLLNRLIIPEKGIELAMPHETGHILNEFTGKFTKILKKCRPAVWLAIPIGLIALLKDKKSEGEKPKQFFDRVTTFIKNNAGKLTFASFIPLIMEEGIASIRGYNAFKKFLTPGLARKVMHTNIISLFGYLFIATILSIGIQEGSKAKDAAHKQSVEK